MQNTIDAVDHERYARCIAASKRVRWDIDRDVIRGRRFDREQKFLPDGLSLVDRFTFLSTEQKRYLGQIQGRTYANIFGLVERYITDKVLELAVLQSVPWESGSRPWRILWGEQAGFEPRGSFQGAPV